ncbi:MAG: hypothetical protein AAFS10_16205, partial [Myxococcota bacterium]
MIETHLQTTHRAAGSHTTLRYAHWAVALGFVLALFGCGSDSSSSSSDNSSSDSTSNSTAP